MKSIKYILFIVFIFSLSQSSAQDSLFIFMNGEILGKYAEAEVDSIKLNNSETTPDRFTIHHNKELENHYYTAVTDSVVFNWQKPALTQDSILKKLEDAYHILYFDSYAAEHYNSIVLMSDLRSDDIFKGGGDAGDQEDIYRLSQFDTSEGALEGLWKIYYEGINRCNSILSSLDNAKDLEPTVLKSVRSEAQFLRAYYLHWLWKFWGNVFYSESTFSDPYILNLYEANDIYDQIMQDIDAIVEAGDLPMKIEENDTQASMAAVLMLKARVVLFQKDESRYAEVLKDMNTIIDSKEFELMPDFAAIWPREGEFCNESIFEVNHRSQPGKTWDNGWKGYGTNLPAFTSPNGLEGNDRLSGLDIYKGGWGFCPVRPEVLNIFENGDVRLAASVNQFAEGDYYGRFQDTGLFLAKYAARKGYNEPPGDTDLNYENNLRIFRLAETYLNIADLIAIQGVSAGEGLTAQQALDAIRTRAGVTSIPATAENVKLERRREFIGEGVRFWDLVRWGDADILTEDLPEWRSIRTWDESKKYLKHPIDRDIFLPKVKYLKTTLITSHSATVYFQIESRGKAPLTECWFTYSRLHDYNTTPININIPLNENASDIYKVKLSDLSGGIEYRINFYATNSFGTSYAYRYISPTPTNISTKEISSMSYNSVTAGGVVTEGDNTEYVSRGLIASSNFYDLLNEEGANVVSNDIGPGSGDFDCELNGLDSNTEYYLRAYVIDKEGVVSYDHEWAHLYKSFTTHARILTKEVTLLSTSSIASGGIVTDDGLVEYVARGLVATTGYRNPEINNPAQNVIVSDIGTGSGSFDSELTGLDSDTEYKIRAYGVSIDGKVDYGNTISIRTMDKEPLDLLTTSGEEKSKSWVINSNVKGHLGVGESGSDGRNWFEALPNDMTDQGFYDDVITFHSDGSFEFDPGVGGTVAVGSNVTIEPYVSYKSGPYEYQAPIDGILSSTYNFNGHSIVFPEMTVVTYIPFDYSLLNPNYRVLSLTEDELILVIDNGSEAFRFVFKPKESGI